VKREKLPPTVVLIVLVVEMENAVLLLVKQYLTVKRIVELAVIIIVIFRLKTLVCVLKIVGIVEMVFVMLLEERMKFLVKWIVVQLFVVMVAALLASQPKPVHLIVLHQILAMFKLPSTLLV